MGKPSLLDRLSDPRALSWVDFLGILGIAIVSLSLIEGGMVVHVSLGTTSGFSLSFANRASAAIVLVGSLLFDVALILKIVHVAIGKFKSSRTPRDG